MPADGGGIRKGHRHQGADDAQELGRVLCALKAEAANPRGDIWWGGTGDPHLQAAEEGLTEPYKSPRMADLQDWAVRQWDASKGRTVGVYAGALGYSYNTDQLKKKNIPEPKCWADLDQARVQGRDPVLRRPIRPVPRTRCSRR